MKTFLKRSKRYVGLAFASLLVFSALFATVPTTTYAQGTPPATPDAPCRGSTAPAGTNCDTIPRGCPGSTLPGPVAPGATLNCPHNPSDNVWKCPTTTCILPSGQVGQNQPGIGTNPPPTPPPADPNANDPELDCNTTETVLDWVICPVVKIVNTALNTLDTAIVNLLEVNPETVNEGSTNGGKYYAAWESFRNIALGILVIGALVMIISQALGFEILDAYTVKKILPRLIVAIIGIALSWEIMAWFVTFTNDLGFGIRSIIYYPFDGIGNPDNTITGGGEGVILTLLTSAGILALGIFGLLTLAGTALLGLLIAFLVLTLRQIIIVTLILLAPIAIACYILPNTQSVWKLWYESFTKALMMFPIIMAFLAVGRVFAQVASADPDKANTIDEFIAFIAYILPYFLIPLTFKFAGGAIRTIGGFVNDRGRGGFDRLKKARQENMETRKEKAASGTLWAQKGLRGKAMTFTQGVAATKNTKLGLDGIRNPSLWRDRVRSTLGRQDDMEVAELMDKDAGFKRFSPNDDFTLASVENGAFGNDKKIAENIRKTGNYDEATISRAVADIHAVQARTTREVYEQAALMSLPSTGTYAKTVTDDQGNVTSGGAGVMMAHINSVAGNDRIKAARMLAGMRGAAEQARRPDLAGGSYAEQLGVMEQQYSGIIRDEVTGERKQGAKISAIQASEKILDSAIEAKGAYQFANARKSTVDAVAPRMLTKLRRENEVHIEARNKILTDRTITEEVREQRLAEAERPFMREAAKVKAFYEEIGRASPENAQSFAEKVMAQHLRDNKGQGSSVRAVLDQVDGNGVFQQYRREYKTVQGQILSEAEQRAQQVRDQANKTGQGFPK